MRTLSPLSLTLLAVVAASCTHDPCADVRTEDEALASTCGIANDTPVTPVGPTRCTPSAGTICTIIGNGEAGVGTNDVAGTSSRTYLPQDMTLGPNGFKDFTKLLYGFLKANYGTTDLTHRLGNLRIHF